MTFRVEAVGCHVLPPTGGSSGHDNRNATVRPASLGWAHDQKEHTE